MTITLENLKENKAQIVERITNEFGTSSVKEIMTKMVNDLDWNSDVDFKDVNAYVDAIFDQVEFTMTRKSPTALQSALSDTSENYFRNEIQNEY